MRKPVFRIFDKARDKQALAVTKATVSSIERLDYETRD